MSGLRMDTYVWREEKKKIDEREGEGRSGAPRVISMEALHKRGNSTLVNQYNNVHQTNVWEGNRKGDKSVKQLVYFVMLCLTEIGSK